MMSNPTRSLELLGAMDAFGLRLSVDDFGTGYSSLTYLKQLPVDELKVDKSFVLQMDHADNDAAIVRTIIGLGRDLGLQVVAEGVESAELLDRLRKLGCSVVQGNYLCHPMPLDEFVAWLDSKTDEYSIAPPDDARGADEIPTT
jgi:EAL domain-containing protein (putative c-di-GMP-specific phosphodiesterase class I)